MSEDLITSASENLRRYWGFDSFLEGQQEAIESVLKGRDTLVLFPTGGGKSLCYQVPATVLGGVTLVLTPLVSLMQDQVARLEKAGIPATFINSTLYGYEVEQRLINARNGMYKLLYLSPERLETTLWQNMAADLKISLVAVDEAHCISQWGHDFRPAYRTIREQLDRLQLSAPCIALTATATPEVQEDIQKILALKDPEVVSGRFQRPNLRWWVTPTHQKKRTLLKAVKKGVGHGSGIVYAGTRARCEKIAKLLDGQGVSAGVYHAGVSADRRQEVQQQWLAGEFPVVVATNAFGMGIDKPDCRFVIHYDLPFSLEAYYQEAGRAGRDGEQAWPLLLYKESDYQTARSRLIRSYPDAETLQKLYDGVCDELNLAIGSHQEAAEPLSIQAVGKRTSLDQGAIRSGLKVLERLNILELSKRREPRLGIRFLIHPEILQDVVTRSGGEKRDLLDLIFRQYGPAAFEQVRYLDLAYLLEKAGCDRGFLMKALDVFADQDRILLYHLLDQDPLVRLTFERNSQLPAGKKEVEGHRNILLDKLKKMRLYAESLNCRERFLRIYFGEVSAGECGHCDRCRTASQD